MNIDGEDSRRHLTAVLPTPRPLRGVRLNTPRTSAGSTATNPPPAAGPWGRRAGVPLNKEEGYRMFRHLIAQHVGEIDHRRVLIDTYSDGTVHISTRGCGDRTWSAAVELTALNVDEVTA